MKLKLICLIALSILCLSALPASASKGKVKLAYVEWDCATASTYTAAAALEKMGYEVEVLPVAAAVMWQAVATGDVDAMVAAWLPNTHADYFTKMKGKVEHIGPITNGAKLGWVVPKYVTIDSITELADPAVAKKFDEKVMGIDPGAGIMRLSENALKDYNLKDMELMEGSGATMAAALQNALKHKKWVVVTSWSPHWMFGKWDLKYLEDPKGSLGEEEHIDTIVRKDLKTDMPEVYEFFKKFKWTGPDQLQMVMAWNQEKGADPAKNAQRFLKEYPEQVKEWTGK